MDRIRFFLDAVVGILTVLRVLAPIPTDCIVSNNTFGIRDNTLVGILVSDSPKIPIERRRRNNVFHEMRSIFCSSNPIPMRRESDAVKARLQRWVELADKALQGKNGNGQ